MHSTCAPAATSASARARTAASLDSVVTTMTGPASRVENNRAAGDVRTRRSKMTRVSGRPR